METLKVTVTAPWGDVEFENGDHSMLLNYARKQLAYFQKQGNTSQELKDDIEGYDILLKTNMKNVSLFFSLKDGQRLKENNLNLEGNLEFINYMKDNGMWQE